MEETKQSLFNAGIAKLERIHNQKNMVHYARMCHNYSMFADALFSIRSELNEWLIEAERIEGDKKELEIRTSLDKSKYDNKTNVLPFVDYERWLNDKEHKYGLSMPDKDDDEGL